MPPTTAGPSARRVVSRLVRTDPRQLARELTADLRAARAVRRSEVFDEAWYRSQLAEPLSDGEDVVRHYVRVGAPQGVSPHPLFHPAWYEQTVKGAERSVLGPFAHYLRRGAMRGDAPHPLFDAKAYLAARPDAGAHPAGILGHFLAHWREDAVRPNAWFDAARHREQHPDADPEQPAIVDFARRTSSRLGHVRPGPPRTKSRTVTTVAAAAFTEEVRAAWRGPSDDDPEPLVSVVLPVRDRAESVGGAIRSALDQTLGRIEVLVIDDGSVDATEEVIRRIDDPRVRTFRQPPAGPYAARNRGLREAMGRYVAYLDADVTWLPDHLELAVAAMETRGHDAVFGALRSSDDETVVVQSLDQPECLVGDDADVTALVHRRDLADRIGGWDETLDRSGSLDYVWRLSRLTDLQWLPVVASERRTMDVRRDRVSVREHPGARDVVVAKHRYDWDQPDTSGSERGATPTVEVSVVVVANRDIAGLVSCVAAVLETTDAEVVGDVVVVDPGWDLVASYRMLQLEVGSGRVRVARVEDPTYGLAIALNDGIRAATGSVVVLLHAGAEVQPGWLEPVVTPVRDGDAVACQPKVIDRAGLVVSTGYVFGPDGMPSDALVGWPEHGAEAAVSAARAAVSRVCLAARREDLFAVGGVDPRFGAAYLDVDLGLRLRARLARPTRYAHDGTVLWLRGEPGPEGGRLEADRRAYERRWGTEVPCDELDGLPDYRVAHRAYDRGPISIQPAAYPFVRPSPSSLVPGHYRPVLQRVVDRAKPLRFAIKVGAPDVIARQRWGDWHFAVSLRAALQRLGHEAVVDLQFGWYRPTGHDDDVVLVLRGRHPYVPNPDQVNLLWLISHPDLVSDAEVARYDRVCVASLTFAHKLSASTGRPVEAMLQCTDAERFVPGPESSPRHELLFVGNSRGQMRPVVRDALAAGLPLTVYGAHWSKLLPAEVIADTYLPNEALGIAYRSAGVVLNDHWEDMRREGFVSNRLFDLAACGANVVTDPVDGLETTFGPALRTYDEPTHLPRVVAEALTNREAERERRVELAAHTRREHSFDTRAARLAELAKYALEARRSTTAPGERPTAPVEAPRC